MPHSLNQPRPARRRAVTPRLAPLLVTALTATLLAAPFGVSRCAAAAPTPIAQNDRDGAVRLDSETAFGEIGAGETLVRRVYLLNDSDAPVTIESVTTDDGDIVAIRDVEKLAGYTIRAGRKRSVGLTITIPNTLGALDATVTVTFAGGTIAPLEIPLSATVIEAAKPPAATTTSKSPPTTVRPAGPSLTATAPVVARPEAANLPEHPIITWEMMSLGDMMPEESHSRSLWLVNTGPSLVTITEVIEDSPALTVDVNAAGMKIPPGRAIGIPMSMTMPAAEGMYEVPVEIRFASQKPIQSKVQGIVRHAPRRGKFKVSDVVVVPGPIVLPDCDPGETQRAAGWLVNRSEKPVTFIGMKPTCSCIKPVPQPRRVVQPGEVLRFDFSMEAGDRHDMPRIKSMRLLFEDDIVSTITVMVTTKEAGDAPTPPTP